jgi:hypothetical protein
VPGEPPGTSEAPGVALAGNEVLGTLSEADGKGEMDTAAAWLGLAAPETETETDGVAEAGGLALGLVLGLELGVAVALTATVGVPFGDDTANDAVGEIVGSDNVGELVGESVGGELIVEPGEFVGDWVVTELVVDELAGEPVGEPVGKPVGELVGKVVAELVGELVTETVSEAIDVVLEAAFEPVGVAVLDCEAEGGAPPGEGDAETSTAMRIALLLWSAMAIAPSAKATALDGLLKAAAAPSPLPKPDAPPKSVVADCVAGSIAITRLPPVSASRRRAPPASYQRPAGTRNFAAAPMPSTESWEPPPTKARATPVNVSTARTS